MKTCAICYRQLIRASDDLCEHCYKTYGKDEPWVKALIETEKHNWYVDQQNYDEDIDELIYLGRI